MNEARFCGRLARDPKMLSHEGQTECLSLTVMVTERRPGREPRTDAVPVKVFGRLAAFAAVHWRKGDWILVRAKLRSRPVGMGFDCDVVAESLEFVGPKNTPLNNHAVAASRASVYGEDEGDLPFLDC